MRFNDCNLFVEKHIFNDGTHIRHSPIGIDDESISDDVTNKEYKEDIWTRKKKSILSLNDELFPLISAAH
jgi:hypothetical protein